MIAQVFTSATKRRLMLIALTAFIFVLGSDTFAQTRYPRPGSARKNRYRGYDYYNKSDKKTGYSRPNRRGGYDYYDASGNRTGSMRKDPESGKYIYYDSEGVKRGSLQKAESLGGEWIPVPGATSPFPLSPENNRQFYRLQLLE